MDTLIWAAEAAPDNNKALFGIVIGLLLVALAFGLTRPK